MTDNPLYQNRYKIFSVGAIGTFMATLDGSIVNVALPSIADKLNCSVDTVAWVVLSYTLTLISLVLIFGAWTQIKGYLFAYRFGYIFFLIGSAICSLSPSIEFLVAGRVTQAIGTAMFAAVGPGMVTTVFPSSERGKGIGMMVMMVSAGFMVGPPLGGFILKIADWNAIFYINLPIGVIGLIMIQRYFKILAPPAVTRKLNLRGGVSVSLALVTLVLALSSIDQYPLSHPRVWAFGMVSLLAFLLFIRFERDPDTALIGVEFLRNRPFVTAMAAALLYFMSFSGVSVLLPFYLERVKGLDPSQVGLLLIIIPIFMFIFSPLSGRLSDKIGFRVLTTAGVIGIMAGLYLFSRLNVGSSIEYIVITLVVTGMGIGIFNTPNSSAMMGSVRPGKRAIASGILATNRNIGMSLGVAVGTTLFTYFQSLNTALDSESARFVASYRPVMFVSLGLAFLALILCLRRDNVLPDTTSPLEPEASPGARP